MDEAIVFPVGEFYSCTDPETLSHTEPEEALEEYLDADLDPRMTVAEVVACIRARPITVTAYNPAEISDRQCDAWAEGFVETLEENWGSEYGDPDGDSKLCGEADAIMREAVRKIVKASRAWTCEDVGKVTLSPDQIEAVMRRYRPDWFEEQRRASPSTGSATPTSDEK